MVVRNLLGICNALMYVPRQTNKVFFIVVAKVEDIRKINCSSGSVINVLYVTIMVITI